MFQPLLRLERRECSSGPASELNRGVRAGVAKVIFIRCKARQFAIQNRQERNEAVGMLKIINFWRSSVGLSRFKKNRKLLGPTSIDAVTSLVV